MNLLLADATNVLMRYAYAQLGSDKQSHPGLDEFQRVARGAEQAFRRVAMEFGATHAVLCFDSEADETFRKALFPDYKKSRPKGQFKWSRTGATFMRDRGWRCESVAGFEGDDVVATLAHRAYAAGKETIIFSGDCDLLQLAGIARCVQFGQRGESKYVERSADWVCAKYGLVALDRMPMYKALVGDTGDDVPGIRGIGPVKATSILLSAEGCALEQVIEQITARGFSVERKDELELMLQLVSLRTDVPISPIAPSECRIPEVSND